MQTVLVTGAAGGIGTRLRQLLKGVYPNVRLSDVKRPADLAADETFVEADLASMPAVENAVAGVDGIVHLGGFSVEGPWDTILQSNIIGCYNLFEAARRHRVERVVFASSNHAVGFYPRRRRIGVDAAVRPDSRYGVSKAFGEALGALYAFKHGLRVTCIRIGMATCRSTGGGSRFGSRRRTSCSSSASASSTPTSATKSSTVRPTMRAAVGQRRRLPPRLSAAGPRRGPRRCRARGRRRA